jgi:hypothetical protein
MLVAFLRRLLAAAFALALSGAAAAASVAFVTDVQGGAKRSGGGKVEFLSEVAEGATLVLDKGARVNLMYTASGHEFALAGPGDFKVGAAEVVAGTGAAAPQRRTVSVRPAPAVVARVSQSATASLRMRSVPPAGRKAGPEYPRGGSIATLHPAFRWAAQDGPGAYEISVRTAEGKELWTGVSESSPHRPPVALAAGSRYSWSVSKGARSLGEASFETMGPEVIARAEKSRAAAKTFSERVLHAIVLQDLGAAADAREAWAELARERPELPELAVLAK